MASVNRIVTVFGASRPKEKDKEYAEAVELGRSLADRGFAVCTGGYGGVMAGVSQGAKEAGGYVIGVTTDLFSGSANQWVDEEIRKESWQDRLFHLVDLGDGYVVCRGGTGTLVEFAVVWEMLNKRVLPPRPFVVMGDFFDPVIERVREVEVANRPPSEQTEPPPWHEATDRLIHNAATPAEAADYMAKKLLNGRQ